MIKHQIVSELQSMGYIPYYFSLEEIQSKDSIYVYRVRSNKKCYIIKYFDNSDYAREINNYKILNSIGVKTMSLIAHTNQSILLEDITRSRLYRLGEENDLNDIDVARNVAKWYKDLHTKGENVVGSSNLYSETDEITKDNIIILKEKSGLAKNKVWKLLLDNIDDIKRLIAKCTQTLNYNDFYWTNLIVAKDMTQAFMFDYNLLGRDYRYSDIRNVCSSLSQDAEKAFMKEYGSYDEKEKIIDNCVSVLFVLISAFKKQKFPSWAKESLELLKNGGLYNSTVKLLHFIE